MIELSSLVLFFIPKSILWLCFIVVAFLIVYCSKQISKYVAGISEKSKLGGAFLGAFVLSLVTSIPELISGITSSLIGNPIQSFGNVIGVNMMTLTVLCMLDIIYVKKALFSKVSNTNRKTIIYVFGFNVLFLLCIFIPKLNDFLTINIGITKFSLVFLFMIVFYMVFIYRVYKLGGEENDEDAESSGCEQLSLKQVVIRFFIFSIILIGLSVLIASITDQMGMPSDEGGYGFGKAAAGLLFLSICTGLPEITTAFSLARLGQGNIALGGIIGSHLFNFLVFFFGDIFFASSGTVQNLYTNEAELLTLRISVIVGMALNMLLFANTFKKNVKNKFVYILPCVIIIALYFVFWFTKDSLIAFFS